MSRCRRFDFGSSSADPEALRDRVETTEDFVEGRAPETEAAVGPQPVVALPLNAVPGAGADFITRTVIPQLDPNLPSSGDVHRAPYSARQGWRKYPSVFAGLPRNKIIDVASYYSDRSAEFTEAGIRPHEMDSRSLARRFHDHEVYSHLWMESRYAYKYMRVLRRGLEIPPEFNFRYPRPEEKIFERPVTYDRVTGRRQVWVGLPVHHFKAGFRLPLHKFLLALFRDELKIALGQLIPNGMRLIIWYLSRCQEMGNEPTMDSFFAFFRVQESGKSRGLFEVQWRNRKLFGEKPVKNPSSCRGWHFEWLFFEGGDLEFLPHYSRIVMKPKVPKIKDTTLSIGRAFVGESEGRGKMEKGIFKSSEWLWSHYLCLIRYAQIYTMDQAEYELMMNIFEDSSLDGPNEGVVSRSAPVAEGEQSDDAEGEDAEGEDVEAEADPVQPGVGAESGSEDHDGEDDEPLITRKRRKKSVAKRGKRVRLEQGEEVQSQGPSTVEVSSGDQGGSELERERDSQVEHESSPEDGPNPEGGDPHYSELHHSEPPPAGADIPGPSGTERPEAPEDVTGLAKKFGDMALGVGSVADGARPPQCLPTPPQGPEGWSMHDMRTYGGFFGSGPTPVDAFNAFALPQDLKFFEDKRTRDLVDAWHRAQGQANVAGNIMCNNLLIRDRQLKEATSNLKQAQAHSRHLSGQVAVSAKQVLEIEGLLKSKQRDFDKAVARMEQLLSENLQLKEALKKAEDKAQEVELQRHSLEGKYLNLKASAQEACLDWADEKRRRAVVGLGVVGTFIQAERDAVPKYLASDGYKKRFGTSLKNSYDHGVREAFEFVGEGTVLDPSKHNVETCTAFYQAKLKQQRKEAV